MMRPVCWLLILAVALVGGSTASAQKGKDKDKDKKPPTLTEAKGVTRLEYSPDGSFVVMDYRNTTPTQPDRSDAILGIWDVKSGEIKSKLDKAPRNCERIAVSADNKKVAAISVGAKQLKIWDATNGKLLDDQKLPDWSGSIQNCPVMKFSPDGTLYGIRDKQMFEVSAGGKFKAIGPKLELFAPEEMTFDAAGKRLVLVNNILGKPAGELRVYDAAKEGDPQKATTTGHIRAVAISRDGKILALSYLPDRAKGGRLEFWDTATWKMQTAAPADTRKDFAHYSVLAFSPDGKNLVGAPLFTKPGNNLVDVLDSEGKIVREIAKPGPKVISLTFSPDGKTLAAVLANHSVLFLDPETGEEKKP